ncbi:hypothetical protein F8M41_005370 [Gigaspora margarita]|uniref:Uncharacterized protein n=1 Tax=Gigaspora margarita TaxID=4874 RepID=A0A8H4A5Y8_GIGMA|nr:hypothetical protein F8M41_005370 [Gigaspora margarita]
MICKHLVKAAGGDSVQLSLVNRYTQYPYIHIENINNKPNDSFLSTNIHSLDYDIIMFNPLLINDYSESNELESFNSMVDKLKYLVTNLEEEIVKGNTHHLQAVRQNIQKMLKISCDIKIHQNHISNLQIWKTKDWTMFLN